MNYLFPVAPQEAPKKRTSRRRKESEPSPPEEHLCEGGIEYRFIAKLDGVVTCLDDGCLGETHDIIDEYEGELWIDEKRKRRGVIWLVECCYCGTKQRMFRIPKHISQERDGEFVFRKGRWAGQTIPEAASDSVGLEYILWAVDNDPDEPVRKACQAWVDARKATR